LYGILILAGDVMSKKNGFTLVELLAVIGILAIIITVSTTMVFTLMRKSKEKIAEEMYSSVVDAALTYSLSNLKLQKCSIEFSKEVFEDEDISGFSSDSTCAKIVTIKTLKDEGFFIDDKDYCDEDSEVLVYRYNDGENSEYKAYVSSNVCTSEKYKTCRDPACGIDYIETCQNEACGFEYNSCRIEACGCETWGEWTTTISSASCTPSSTNSTQAYCIGYGDSIKLMQRSCLKFNSCQNSECGKVYKTCKNTACGVTYRECSTKNCGEL
jgi:prepilin-type N-terminal cleavage/methylation domain-containing protein